MNVNELISNWFEPKPDYRPNITGSISGIMVMTDQPSQTQAWKYEFKNIPRPGSAPNDFTDLVDASEWKPLEWDTDEAANSRLLQKLVDRATPYGIAVSIGVRHCDSYDGKSVYWLETVEKYGDDELIPVQEASSINEAVVLAFLKFAKIDATSQPFD